MIEWLLTRFDPLMLDQIKHLDLIQDKMAIALREIGITNFNDRRGGIQNDLSKSIMGLNGLHDSIQLLYRVTQFIVHSTQA